jgi:abequosyltransferase
MHEQTCKLSICISTFNRASFIGATLKSIIAQATSDCEIVVLDGGSTDDTQLVVSEHGCDLLRYFRQDVNNGLDRDYDRAVELARGDYCWLMTDDDFLKPGAVAAVLEAIRRDVSLIVVNAESRDFSMSKVLQRRWLDFESDRVYGPEDMDRLFVELGDSLKYIGGMVVKRAIWLARERERYYGSLFIYLGVIFQERLPSGALVIAEPLITCRMGNSHAFSPKLFEALIVNFPSLVWSLAISESAKSKVCVAEPWRSLHELLLWRAWGFYSLLEYRRWIRPRVHSTREALAPTVVALLPGALVNALLIFYYSLTSRSYRGIWQPDVMVQFLRESRHYFRNWRVFRRES